MTKLADWIARVRHNREIDAIRREMETNRHMRDIGVERDQRLYKRLAELGEFVPGYMKDQPVAGRLTALDHETLARRHPHLAEALRRVEIESECA